MSITSIIKTLLFVGICNLSVQSLIAQRLKNDIPVIVGADTIPNPWTGAVQNAQFSSIDLDNDGLLDLLIFDRSDYSVMPFLNKGEPGVVDYHYAPEYIDVFPDDLIGWVLARDFDGDGYMDLFSGTLTSNVRVYRNVSASNNDTLRFQLFKNPITSRYPSFLNLFAPLSDIPAIDDLDGDGDLDILTFDVLGYQVEWHKNLSVDSFASLDSLEFVLQSYCYGHFFEDNNTCAAFTNQQPCAPGMKRSYDPNQFVNADGTIPLRGVHAGSTLLSLDHNADGLKDLVVGDIGCTTVYTMLNNGTTSIANFDSVLSPYPLNTAFLDIYNFPGVFYMDVDNDGIKDLVAGPNELFAGIDDDRGTSFHKNNGQNNQPNFSFVQDRFMTDGMIEVGTGAYPVFFDYNNDGLSDLLISNLGRFDSIAGGTYVTGMSLYLNVGDGIRPAFKLLTDDFLGFASQAQFSALDALTPTFGDLDNDGDEDLIIGEADGGLIYFENIAMVGAAQDSFIPINSAYFNIDVGLHSAPQLFDVDNDNDLDLIIGNHRGYVAFYENTGTAALPQFDSVTTAFGGVKINDFTGNMFSNGYSKPYMIDYDTDGKVEMLVGSIEGEIQIYEDISLVPGDTFTYAGNFDNRDFGSFSSPATAVLDSSGRLSFFIGVQRGGVQLYGDLLPTPPVGIVKGPEPGELETQLYPNPASEQINVVIRGIKGNKSVRYRIFNSIGQTLEAGAFNGNRATLDVASLSSGIYFLHLESDAGISSKKFQIQ